MNVTLVLSGGSTKAPLHVGFLQAVEEYDYTIDSIFCNSAGSIIGAAIACGYNYDKLYKLILKTDFSKLLDHSFFDFMKKAYLSTGDKAELFYKSIFGDIKFSDLSIDLNIMGHSLKSKTNKIFNKINTPDVYLYDAVRASTSVPLLFKPKKINNEFYIDGGVTKDFPIDLVPTGKFYIGHLIQSDMHDWEKDNVLEFGLSLIDQLIQGNVEESIKRAHTNGILVRTTFELPITNFNISLADKMTMMEIGYQNTIKKFSNGDI